MDASERFRQETGENMSTTPTRMSLEDYLNFEDGTETQYELVNGELFEVPPESDLNQRIVSFLFAYFLQQGFPHASLRTKAEIVVSGSRVTVRVPDLMVLSEELASALKGASRSTVMMDMPPPQLVVEVVSPGKENEDRDYRFKRSEYAARGIAEYWIVDPMRERVTVLTLVDGLYDEAVFEGGDEVISGTLQAKGKTSLVSAAKVLRAEA